jgi:positive regulator of sigma E activity
MDYKEDTAIVKECGDGYAVIEIQKTESCKSCGMNSICGKGASNSQCRVKTDILLNPGDRVKIYVSGGIRIISSLILFIFPILMMIIFYLIAKYVMHFTENFSILSSFLGLLLSGISIYLIDKKLADKVNIVIVEKVE